MNVRASSRKRTVVCLMLACACLGGWATGCCGLPSERFYEPCGTPTPAAWPANAALDPPSSPPQEPPSAETPPADPAAPVTPELAAPVRPDPPDPAAEGPTELGPVELEQAGDPVCDPCPDIGWSRLVRKCWPKLRRWCWPKPCFWSAFGHAAVADVGEPERVPPHPRYHPVPTGPVFESREPFGVLIPLTSEGGEPDLLPRPERAETRQEERRSGDKNVLRVLPPDPKNAPGLRAAGQPGP